MSSSPRSLAQYIDHTLLRPDATKEEIVEVCREAVELGFKTVCVERQWLPVVLSSLQGSKVLPIAVISFPKGDEPTTEKVRQANEALKLGAREIDMVLNRTALKDKHYDRVWSDIAAVVRAVSIPVKVILEISELSDQEIIAACALAKAAGARFVKTSTGFSSGGATVERVRLMRQVVGEDMGVKASGGIRTTEDAEKMIEAGANRIGASASVAIVGAAKEARKGY